MSKFFKLSIVITMVWLIVSVVTIFNMVYSYYPEGGNDFWLVFVRSVTLLSILPLLIAWGGWWALKK